MKQRFRHLVQLDSDKRNGLFFLTVGFGIIIVWGSEVINMIIQLDLDAEFSIYFSNLIAISVTLLFPGLIGGIAVAFGLGLLGVYDKKQKEE